MLAGTYMLPSPASSIQVSFNQHSDVSPSPSRLSYHNCCHIFDKLDLCAAGGLRGLGGVLRPPRAADASPAGGRCLSLPHIRWVKGRYNNSLISLTHFLMQGGNVSAYLSEGQLRARCSSLFKRGSFFLVKNHNIQLFARFDLLGAKQTVHLVRIAKRGWWWVWG